MATIKLSNKQLRLIQTALDFYSRVGSLQLDEILTHPTIDNIIINQFTEKKELEVGDRTVRGIIVEINEKNIKTKGCWSKEEEIRTWTDTQNIKLSPDWEEVHRTKDSIRNHLNHIKCVASGESFSNGGNYGIYSNKVDESCREAYDMIQVIRHEFWKEDPNHSGITVDSSTHLSDQGSEILVELDTVKDVRKQKLNKIKS